jgi:hypothetical protein
MRRLIAFIGTAIALTACAPGYDAATTTTTVLDGSPAAQLAAAEARWATVGPADYTFEFTNDCGECDPTQQTPRRIAVLDGTVLAVETDTLPTVEEVFASIGEALEAGRQVQVTYDSATGAPLDVQIDMHQRPVDGGTHWILTDFTQFRPVDSAAELEDARRTWDALGLDSYQFLLNVDCDACDEEGAFDVKVVDDRIVEAVRLTDPGEISNVTPVTINQTFEDFEEWFTEQDGLIDQGILEVDIRVDPIMGYPRWVYVKAQDPSDSTELFEAIVTMDLVARYEPDDSPDPDDLAALREAGNRWEFTAITDYRYTLTFHCMCTEEYSGPFEVTVRDRQVVAATWKGNPIQPNHGPVYTIEQVFELIEQTVEDGVDVEVAYDPDSGHPTNVILDVEAVAVDGGMAFSIANLHPLGEPGVVAGRVLAGPTCPVQQDPPDPDCADRPVEGAVLVVLSQTGTEVARATSNDNGYVEVALEPGTYRFEPQAVEGLLGTGAPFELDLAAGDFFEVTILYDTGIR